MVRLRTKRKASATPRTRRHSRRTWSVTQGNGNRKVKCGPITRGKEIYWGTRPLVQSHRALARGSSLEPDSWHLSPVSQRLHSGAQCSSTCRYKLSRAGFVRPRPTAGALDIGAPRTCEEQFTWTGLVTLVPSHPETDFILERTCAAARAAKLTWAVLLRPRLRPKELLDVPDNRLRSQATLTLR